MEGTGRPERACNKRKRERQQPDPSDDESVNEESEREDSRDGDFNVNNPDEEADWNLPTGDHSKPVMRESDKVSEEECQNKPGAGPEDAEMESPLDGSRDFEMPSTAEDLCTFDGDEVVNISPADLMTLLFSPFMNVLIRELGTDTWISLASTNFQDFLQIYWAELNVSGLTHALIQWRGQLVEVRFHDDEGRLTLRRHPEQEFNHDDAGNDMGVNNAPAGKPINSDDGETGAGPEVPPEDGETGTGPEVPPEDGSIGAPCPICTLLRSREEWGRRWEVRCRNNHPFCCPDCLDDFQEANVTDCPFCREPLGPRMSDYPEWIGDEPHDSGRDTPVQSDNEDPFAVPLTNAQLLSYFGWVGIGLIYATDNMDWGRIFANHEVYVAVVDSNPSAPWTPQISLRIRHWRRVRDFGDINNLPSGAQIRFESGQVDGANPTSVQQMEVCYTNEGRQGVRGVHGYCPFIYLTDGNSDWHCLGQLLRQGDEVGVRFVYGTNEYWTPDSNSEPQTRFVNAADLDGASLVTGMQMNIRETWVRLDATDSQRVTCQVLPEPEAAAAEAAEAEAERLRQEAAAAEAERLRQEAEAAEAERLRQEAEPAPAPAPVVIDLTDSQPEAEPAPEPAPAPVVIDLTDSQPAPEPDHY